MPAMTRASISGRRRGAVRSGGVSEERLTVEPLVTVGDDMQLGVRFGRESWKAPDIDFPAAASTVFSLWLS